MAIHTYDREDVIKILMQTVRVEPVQAADETASGTRVANYSIIVKDQVLTITAEFADADVDGSKLREQLVRRSLACMALKEIDAP